MKPGAKPKGQVIVRWSPEFAYAIGLLTADGCVLNDGRHIDFTSKDIDQVETFKNCLKINTKISIKHSGIGNPYHRVQFSDVLFHKFLRSIGITPAKSKTISSVLVPDIYFRDFLRGYFDGDGTTYSFHDSIFPKSYRFYMSFASASPAFVDWLREKINEMVNVKGHISRYLTRGYLQLKYAKREAIVMCRYMYYKENIPFLGRKYLKIRRSLSIINQGRGGEIGKHATFRA